MKVYIASTSGTYLNKVFMVKDSNGKIAVCKDEKDLIPLIYADANNHLIEKDKDGKPISENLGRTIYFKAYDGNYLFYHIFELDIDPQLFE